MVSCHANCLVFQRDHVSYNVNLLYVPFSYLQIMSYSFILVMLNDSNVSLHGIFQFCNFLNLPSFHHH